MAELVFPVVATLLWALVAIPVATIVCKATLILIRQHARSSAPATAVREAGAGVSYLLLIAPVVVPTAWLVSAAVHHAEAGEAGLTCLFDRISAGTCVEPLVIALAVGAALTTMFLWRGRGALSEAAKHHRLRAKTAERRIDWACSAQPRLALFRERIHVVEGDELRTVGLFRPSIEVGVVVAHRLDETALIGALLHEYEHVSGLDPLRFVFASVCQSLNPVSFLLDAELARWRMGREAMCDEAAVHQGANPLDLAEALVAVARPRSATGGLVAHLGGGIEALRFRVTLLMDYVTSPPRCRCGQGLLKLAVLAMVGICALPHWFGGQLMVDLHQSSERIVYESFLASVQNTHPLDQ